MTAAPGSRAAVSAPRRGELDDHSLVQRVVTARDEEAFRQLYQRHTPVLFAMAMRLTAEAADAEDAVHDAWLRAIDALGRFEWRSSLRTWLVSILINRIRELDRNERSFVTIDDDAVQPENAPELPRNVDAFDLEAAIRALPPGYKRVLVLHDVEGFTHEDIAAMLGVTPGTSKSQLAHARRRLRSELSADAKETP